MNSLLKLYENQTDTIYVINDKMQGLVDIPKDLNNNIKLFMLFKDNNFNALQDSEKQKLLYEMINTSKKINNDAEDGLFLVAFIEDSILTNVNAFSYTNELHKIKSLVNNIYNKLLKEGKLKKENFIKKVELLYSDDNYKNFMDWLCMQVPSKFRANSYQELLNKNNSTLNTGVVQTNVNVSDSSEKSQIQTNAQYLPNNNYDIPNVTQPNNTTPINESLTIGSFKPPVSSYNPQSHYTHQKKLINNFPNNNNAAFINWGTIIFILILSFVIGISLSIYLLNK